MLFGLGAVGFTLVLWVLALAMFGESDELFRRLGKRWEERSVWKTRMRDEREERWNDRVERRRSRRGARREARAERREALRRARREFREARWEARWKEREERLRASRL